MKTSAVALALVLTLSPLVAQEASDTSSLIDFSFDQVELQTFVQIVSKETGKRFIVGENAGGKISIVTPQIRASQVYPLFLSILESINCAVVATDDPNTFQIVKLGERGMPEPPVSIDPVTGAGELVTRVLRLQHVRSGELVKALRSRLGDADGGRIAAVETTNHLIITDTSQNVQRLETIIAEIDQPGHARVTEVVRLQHADAESIARELSTAVAGGMTMESARAEMIRKRLGQAGAGSGGGPGEPAIVASPHSNSLILVGTQAQIEDLKRIVGLMDVDSASGMNAIKLRYLDPVETAQSLNALLEKSGRRTEKGPGTLALEASVTTGSILVDGTPRDVQMVRELIEELDISPEQVHIEVLIAEVSVGDDFNWGISLGGFSQPNSVGDTVLNGSMALSGSDQSILDSVQNGIFPSGITLALGHGVRLDGSGNLISDVPGLLNIDAVKRNSNVKILANTSLEAENNREASVQIVNNIPLLKSTVQGTGTSRDIVENIDRIDVGIKLKITPHVNPEGKIQLKLAPSIEAIIDPGPADKPFAPTIARREVTTTITVNDGDTAIISGLTREDETEIERRVPILGSIPLIGWLFRGKVVAREKTNVMIMVSPTIVRDGGLAGRIREAFEARTGVDTSDVRLDQAPAPEDE